MRTAAVCLSIALISSAFGATPAAEKPEANDTALAKKTITDMRSVATATEAYATDENKYPEGKSVADIRPLIEPTYIKNPPAIDAWGTPFAYRVDATHQRFRLVSAGPDRKFDPSSLDIEKKPAASDDIIYEDGDFTQAPKLPDDE